MATEEQGAAVKRATDALINALQACGVDNDATICMAAAGSLVGCLAAASAQPALSLASMISVARGIISGELLDD